MKRTISIIMCLLMISTIFTAITTVSAEPGLIDIPFSDDFEDGDHLNWNDASEINGDIRVESGNLNGTGNYYLYMDSPKEPDNRARAILENGENPEWYDYELECDAQIISRTGGTLAYINIFFYLQSTNSINNGYYFHFRENQNQVSLFKIEGGIRSELALEKFIYIDIGVPYHIKIIVNDGNIQLFIDGKRIIDTEDSTFTYGTIGFSTHGGGKETVRSAVDNIQVNYYENEGGFPDFSFVHITDVHIGWPGAKNKFERIIEDINNLDPLPKFVFITGDLTYPNFLFGYSLLDNFDDLLLNFNPGIKIFVTVGNHDYDNDLPEPPEYELNHDDYEGNIFNDFYEQSKENNNFIFLNSGKGSPESEGLLTTQITKLEKSLKDNKYKNNFIFMHHPALNGKNKREKIDDYDDNTITNNRLKFIELCRFYDVKLVLTGHTHYDKIYYTTESKNGDLIQHKMDSVDEIEKEMMPLFVQTRSVTWTFIKQPIGKTGYRIIDVYGQEVEVHKSIFDRMQMNVSEMIQNLKDLNSRKGHIKHMINSLDIVNDLLDYGDIFAAIIGLEYFIYYTNRKRGKDPLSDEIADVLIVKALAIIVYLFVE